MHIDIGKEFSKRNIPRKDQYKLYISSAVMVIYVLLVIFTSFENCLVLFVPVSSPHSIKKIYCQ